MTLLTLATHLAEYCGRHPDVSRLPLRVQTGDAVGLDGHIGPDCGTPDGETWDYGFTVVAGHLVIDLTGGAASPLDAECHDALDDTQIVPPDVLAQAVAQWDAINAVG